MIAYRGIWVQIVCQEVSRSLAALPYVDASSVLAYLKVLGSPTAVARTGWLLEQRAKGGT